MTVNLFNPTFYRTLNPSLAAAGITTDAQLTDHFQRFGLQESRLFSPLVDLNLYRQLNPDLTAAGLTTNQQLFNHLQDLGVAEGRQFSRVFDLNFYGQTYSDLRTAGLNNEQLFEHFLNSGINEGRVGSASFDADFYVSNHPDLQAAGLNDLQALIHYVTLGIQEGRSGSPTGGSNTLLAEVDLGNLTGTRSVSNAVGDADPEDIYRLIISTPSNFRATLGGLSADADIDLIQDFNSNGVIDFQDIIDASLNGDTNTERISINPLVPGTYFVRVFQAEGDTNYNLNLSIG